MCCADHQHKFAFGPFSFHATWIQPSTKWLARHVQCRNTGIITNATMRKGFCHLKCNLNPSPCDGYIEALFGNHTIVSSERKCIIPIHIAWVYPALHVLQVLQEQAGCIQACLKAPQMQPLPMLMTMLRGPLHTQPTQTSCPTSIINAPLQL